MKNVAAAIVLALLLSGASARAEGTTKLTVWIDESVSLAPDAVRQAIANELGVDVDLAAKEASPSLRVARRSSGELEIVFDEKTPSSSRHAERVLTRPADDAVAIETVAFLAGNLVRDEASELVTRLRKARAERIAAATPPAPPPPPAAQTPVPAPAPAPAPADERGACDLARGGSIGADFVPYLGSSSTEAGREATRRASLNVIGGVSSGLNGAEVGGVFNVQRRFACGVQIGGVANSVLGPVTGVQIGGVVNYTQGKAEGLELGGVANWTPSMHGAQVAGAVNVASQVEGVQVAPVNVAGKVNGVQVGVVNVAREVDVPIGAVSIVTNGRTHVDAWHDTGLTMAGVVHGSKRVHNIYAAGARLYGEDARPTLAAGLGVRVYERAFPLDVDALSIWLPGKTDHLRLHAQMRAVAGIRLTRGVSLMAGASWNVEVTDDPEEDPSLPLRNVGGDANGTRVISWPGLLAGVRFFE